MSANQQVRSEIQIFLQALNSYPEQFAKEPGLTFEEYRRSLIRGAKTSSRRQA